MHSGIRHSGLYPTEPLILFASIAGDARGSVEHSLQLVVSESLQSTVKNRIAVVDAGGDEGTNECRCRFGGVQRPKLTQSVEAVCRDLLPLRDAAAAAAADDDDDDDDTFCGVCQVDALNITLSDNSLALAESQERASQLQKLIAASEQDRRVLQERLDTTRSATSSSSKIF